MKLISKIYDYIWISVENLKLQAYMSKVTECDALGDLNTIPDYMEEMPIKSGYATINNDLTSDVSDFEFPSEVAENQVYGNVRIIFVVVDDSGNQVYGTKSLQVKIESHSNASMGDVKLNVTYGSEQVNGTTSEVPLVEVGDLNPFGIGSNVTIDYGSCYSPKTIACLYCGFDDGDVGVDEDTWNTWQSVQVFEKNIRVFQCVQ